MLGQNQQNVMRGIPLRQKAHYDVSGNLEFFPAIVGGKPAMEGEFPSHVSIQDRNGRHICGGTLIDLDYVLTASHCVSTDLGEMLKPDTVSKQFINNNKLYFGYCLSHSFNSSFKSWAMISL